MGLFDKLKNPGTIIGGPVGGLLWDATDFDGKKAKAAQSAFESAEEARRAQAKKTQYDLLGQLKGPQVSAQNEARLRALEEESKLGLEADPNFQSQLRQARTGGAQSLASIQNKQAATGAGGGFQNVGSMNDVYDRLGVQLADLAGQQQQFREQKRDKVADARQGIADAQIEYENAITNAKMAIESGDAQAAQEALARAHQARAAIQNKFTQNLMGLGSMAIGAISGNPGAAAGGAKTMAQASEVDTTGGYRAPTVGSSFGITQSKANLPYYMSR